MNVAQKNAIKQQISYLEDNLYRYKTQESHAPGSMTGNGETFVSVIADHERTLAELREGM